MLDISLFLARAQLHTLSVSTCLLQVSSRSSNELWTFLCKFTSLGFNQHYYCKLSLCIWLCFVCCIWFRSIPVNRLQQIIEVLESDIVVRLVLSLTGLIWREVIVLTLLLVYKSVDTKIWTCDHKLVFFIGSALLQSVKIVLFSV